MTHTNKHSPSIDPLTTRRPSQLTRRGFLSSLWLLPGLLMVRPAWAIETPPLVLGIFPNATAKQIIETYRPLADALEKTLQRRVEIYTAPNFKSFVERTRQGEYDLLLTAPHLAWLARQDAGYQPLLKYTQQVRGLLVVKATSPYRSTEALRNHTIAIADALAVVVMAMQDELAKGGLKRNIDYHTVDAGTHINAAMQVIHGRTDAAIVGLHPYKLMPPDVRSQLRVLAETPPLSSLAYLTHPRLREPVVKTIQNTLLSFAASPEGQAFLQRGGFGGFGRFNNSELNAVRPYALQAQKMLQDMQ